MYLFLNNTALYAVEHLTFSAPDGSKWCISSRSLYPRKRVSRTNYTRGLVGPGAGLEALGMKMPHVPNLLRFKRGFVVYPASSLVVRPTVFSRFHLELQVMNCTSIITNKRKDNSYIRIPTNYETQIKIDTKHLKSKQLVISYSTINYCQSCSWQLDRKHIYTGCFTTLGHNCRRWFPRPLWSKKFI